MDTNRLIVLALCALVAVVALWRGRRGDENPYILALVLMSLGCCKSCTCSSSDGCRATTIFNAEVNAKVGAKPQSSSLVK